MLPTIHSQTLHLIFEETIVLKLNYYDIQTVVTREYKALTRMSYDKIYPEK